MNSLIPLRRRNTVTRAIVLVVNREQHGNMNNGFKSEINVFQYRSCTYPVLWKPLTTELAGGWTGCWFNECGIRKQDGIIIFVLKVERQDLVLVGDGTSQVVVVEGEILHCVRLGRLAMAKLGRDCLSDERMKAMKALCEDMLFFFFFLNPISLL